MCYKEQEGFPQWSKIFSVLEYNPLGKSALHSFPGLPFATSFILSKGSIVSIVWSTAVLRWSNALCPAAASKSQQQPLGHPDKSLLSIHQTPHVESEFFTSEKARYYIADVRKLRSKGSVSPWSMNEMYALGNLRKMTVSTQIISNSHRGWIFGQLRLPCTLPLGILRPKASMESQAGTTPGAQIRSWNQLLTHPRVACSVLGESVGHSRIPKSNSEMGFHSSTINH